MPNEQFCVYGAADGGQDEQLQGWLNDFDSISNISYKGAFNSFEETDYKAARCFLYTSDNDGVPIVLLEAAALGLPIVAPAIGGIPEFISDETGWLVREHEDFNEYVNCLIDIKREPEQATERARSAKNELRQNYSYEALNRTITALPEFF
jgi:glycosyltransferase involved in cell wall biosynthesis